MVRYRTFQLRSAAPRPLIYLAYVRDWFVDVTNFRRPQTRKWDALGAAEQKLFARLDAEAYVRQLEAALRAKGGSPEALASHTHPSRSEEL